MEPLIAIEGLTICAPGAGSSTRVVRNLSLEIDRGEILGLCGESGSGKTVTALALVDLLPPGLEIEAGKITLDGQNLLGQPHQVMRGVRGGRIGLVLQEPASALNPVLTIGYQIRRAIQAHAKVPRQAAQRQAAELLARVAMPDPHRCLKEYPHRLSGGQRQRVMIAIALAGSPQLLVADEPTTALDLTTQAEICELLRALRRELGLGILLITHDLGVVAEVCDRVSIICSGELVESAPIERIFGQPAHPYSRSLLAALPGGDTPGRGEWAVPVSGGVSDRTAPPAGCVFQPRCSEASSRCAGERPAEVQLSQSHRVRCFLHDGDGRR